SPPASTLFPYTTLFRSLATTALPQGGLQLGMVDTAAGQQTEHSDRADRYGVVPQQADGQTQERQTTRAQHQGQGGPLPPPPGQRSEEHTSELQSLAYLV